MPKIGIDAGHSDVKPGARANGIEEEDIALDIAKRLKRAVIAEGWNPFMVREDGRTEPGIGTRGKMAKDAGCDVLVSIHLNAGGGKGYEVFYNAGDTEDQRFAGFIADAIKGVYGTVHGKAVKRDDESSHTTLSVLDMAGGVPACLVELGFVDDKTFADLIKKPEAREVFALAIHRGIKNYLVAKKKVSLA